MGCLQSTPKKELVFLVIGLDNSGKTTLTRTIAGGASARAHLHSTATAPIPLTRPSLPAPDIDPFVVPTIGFSAPIRKAFGQWAVTFYDLGGGARIRGVWPQYFADVHGVVFVVDSSDAARLDEAAKELHAALAHPMIVGKPTLVCVAAPRVAARRLRALTPTSPLPPPHSRALAVFPTRRTSRARSTRRP